RVAGLVNRVLPAALLASVGPHGAGRFAAIRVNRALTMLLQFGASTNSFGQRDMSQASLSKSLAPHDAALPERPRKRKPFFTSERGLGLAGVVLAAASGSFAAYMISDTTRQPHISGAEYFNVFAKLTPSGRANPTGATRPQLPESETDELKTASI